MNIDLFGFPFVVSPGQFAVTNALCVEGSLSLEDTRIGELSVHDESAKVSADLNSAGNVQIVQSNFGSTQERDKWSASS